MPPKRSPRSKRKRETQLLDLPNEILVCILQWCDTVTVYKLGLSNKRLRTVTDHYNFHRKFPLAADCSPSQPLVQRGPWKLSTIQLHPAILHAAWRPAFGYDDIQIMMGLQTFDLLGSGVEDQAATDPPITECRIHSARRSWEWDAQFPPGYSRVLELLPATGRILTVRDVLKRLVTAVARLLLYGSQERYQVYRVPLQTSLEVVPTWMPVLWLSLRPHQSLRYAKHMDPTGKRFCIKAPAKRFGYSLRSNSANAEASRS
ncbi:hypothetical protein OC845_005717 [Tilletia horrida]|nr:hypothetical protein OC845_005717 [Tilletia horrida]